jgi:hypothetical protein
MGALKAAVFRGRYPVFVGGVLKLWSCLRLYPARKALTVYIQDIPEGKVNILEGHSIGHSKQEFVYVHVSYSERVPPAVQTSNTSCPHTSCKVH